MPRSHRLIPVTLALSVTLITLFVPLTLDAAGPQSPEQFLGHQVGADYKLAPWEKIVDYFRHMDTKSERITVRDLGTTTEGRPMILAEISDAATIANLTPHREDQRAIADPRLIANETEEQQLIHDSKVAILINCQLHSTEVAASQMAMEFAYDLVTGNTPEIRQILEHVIVLLIPCANPDGQQKVVDWYNKTLGLPWEGTGMPWLYQTYAGHDNNRDWFMLNLKETRLTTKVLYEEWFPTILWDVHQMGNSGARFFVPPFYDPKNQNVHPIIDQSLLIIGGHMAAELARQGKKGVVHGAIYDNWWAGGFRMTPYRHNIVGILTEAASVNIASPVFQRKSQLKGGRRGMPSYAMATNFPDPWPGGWWRLRDIVEYEKAVGMSLLTLAARYHDMYQGNYIHIARESIEKGRSQPPFAWLVPPGQRDPGSTYEMLERLHATAIELHIAEEPFEADGVVYPEGTYIVYCAQPYRPHLMDMMERQVYPDRAEYPGGPAEQPYDMAGWTLPLQMGVHRVAVSRPFKCRTRKVGQLSYPQGRMLGAKDPRFWVVPAANNDDYRLLNRLYEADIPFSIYVGVKDWTLKTGEKVPPGSLVIPASGGVRKTLNRLTRKITSNLIGLKELSPNLEDVVQDAIQPRTALYQPWTASMDEGWTRLVLEQFEMPYTSIHNAEIRAGNLRRHYDCIVIPSLGVDTILEGRAKDSTFPEYVGGIGLEGVVNLQEFVQQGGTLVCIDNSCNLPIKHFNIPVRNIIADKASQDFYCPGSVLRLAMDIEHPLGFGMPKWYSGYFARSQAFGLDTKPAEKEKPTEETDDDREPAKRFPATVVSRYSDTILLESGWIRGGELIADQPAIVEVDYGDGYIDLIAFGVQRRGQPHSTFRILFNAIQRSTLKSVEMGDLAREKSASNDQNDSTGAVELSDRE
jgi:hypothetical protein